MNRHERRRAEALLRVRPGPSGVAVMDRRTVPEGKCDLCGKEDELRPYGANGEWICFECGQKDKAATARRFREVVFGDKEH